MPNNQQQHPTGTMCPFSMGNPNGPQECNAQCKLYRPGKNGFECYFQEIQSISWNTRKSPPNGGGGPPGSYGGGNNW